MKSKQRTVAVYLRVNEGQGKQPYYPAAYAGNRNLLNLVCLIKGKQVYRAEGVYYLRYRSKDSKRHYEHVGTDPQLALTKRKQREIIIAAEDSGLETMLVTPVLRPKQTITAGSVAGLVNPYALPADASNGRLALAATIDRFIAEKEVSTRGGFKERGSRARELRFQLGEFLKQTRCTYLDEVGDDAILSYVAHMQKQGKSVRTIENRVAAVSAFLRRYGFEKAFRKSLLPKPHKVDPRFYDEEVLAALFAAATPEEYITFKFFLLLGLREREVMFSAWTDIQWRTNTLRVSQKPSDGFITKSGRERSVPIPAELLCLLKERQKVAAHPKWIFPTVSGKPNGHLLRDLQYLAFRAGLNCGHCETRGGKSCKSHPCCRQFGLHMFRRTFATYHHEAGVPLHTLMSWLGHQHMETTELYLGLTTEENARQHVMTNNTWANKPLGKRATVTEIRAA